MAARIWEVAALIQEKRDSTGNLLEEAILVHPPQYVVAATEQKALVELAELIPPDIKDDPLLYDRLEFAVRPF